jgi:hypothetical protein
MGYTKGGIGNNGQGIGVPITPEIKSPRKGIGYDIVVSSIPTPRLSTTKEVFFVAGGFQTGFPEEKPIVDCVEHIDELHVTHMPEFEHVITYDIVVDMLGFSTPVSEPKPKPTSSNQIAQKYMPYNIYHHKNRRNGNHTFKYLQKRHERQNCGPLLTTRIDCGWIDGW